VSDEDLIEPGKAGEVVGFFTKDKKASAERTIEDELAYAYEMKLQRDEAEKEYKLSMDRIKSAMKVDGVTGKRQILTAGDYNLIVMKKSGAVKIDWEKWAEDVVGPAAVKELEAAKALVREGKADSKYVSVGKEVVSCELVKRTAQDYPI